MMATAKPKTTIGTMPCLCCGESVPVKQSEGGTLNFSCSWCDFPGYAKAGTEARRLILLKTKLSAPETAPAPAVKPAAPAPATKTATAAPVRKATTIFG